MKIIREFEHVRLPVEAEESPCEEFVVDRAQPPFLNWLCTLAPGHDGPHVATFDDEHGDTWIGLAWTA